MRGWECRPPKLLPRPLATHRFWMDVCSDMLAGAGERAVLGTKGTGGKAAAPAAVSRPTRHQCATCLSCEAVGSRGVVACSSGWLWGEAGGVSRRSPVPKPAPNKALHLTAYSLRSYVASASGGR